MPRPRCKISLHTAYRSVAAAVAVTAGLAPADRAHAQESLTNAELSELIELADPPGLPGRDKGDRAVAPEGQPPEPQPPREWVGARPWLEWERATGDWGGARATLEEHGVEIAGSYTLHWSTVLEGGLRNVASARHLLDVNATFDLEVIAGIRGATVYADFYLTDVRGGSRDSGDTQGISVIDTGQNVQQLAEVWWEQRLLNGAVRLKLGKIDANTEFNFVDGNFGFMSSSPAMSPTLFVMPSYPNPAFGGLVFWYPAERLYVGGGIFDGATNDGWRTGDRGPDTLFSDDKSDSWFMIAEAGFKWDAPGPCGQGRAAVGAWRHTGNFETVDGGTDDGSHGVYAQAELQILRRGDSDDDKDKGLYAFVQLGFAEEDVNVVRTHLAAGLSIAGPFVTRSGDACGIYCSFADLSEADGISEDETMIELYYKLQAAGSVAVSPSVQYIFNPSGDPAIEDALVAQLGVEISF